ncbi:MAG TPA: hypothetical protein VGJ05_18050 [Fimbriiglobus sp.]|jgi:hypothetical protein
MKSLKITALGLGLAGGIAAFGWNRTPAQPPAQADYIPIKSRTATLKIDYDPVKRKDILNSRLLVSRDKGLTWELEDTATPDRTAFKLEAKEDGVYWVKMQTVFTNGSKDPPDSQIATQRADQKLLMDGTPPAVRISSAKRIEDEIAVAWSIDEKFPNEAETKLSYRPAGSELAVWQDVPNVAGKTETRFKVTGLGAYTVRVTAKDLAGNEGLMTADVPGTTTTVAYTPPIPPLTGQGNAAPPAGAIPAPIFPTSRPAEPDGIVAPGPIQTPNIPTDTASVLPAPAAVGPAAINNQVAPNWTPPAPTHAPAQPTETNSTPKTISTPPQPLATTSQIPVAGDSAPTRFVNFSKFDLAYTLNAGPSGVNKIQLWVTRDDGRNWQKWSDHDGKESPLHVDLEKRWNANLEGAYGFKLVPESGARQTDGAPTPGTPPEFRCVVDLTPPTIEVLAPSAHPTMRDTISLKWRATDANFGKDPIAFEWSETPQGPWRAVNAGDDVRHVVAGNDAGPPRMANTSEYAWHLPTDLTSPRVFLKVTAWDAAGNKREVMTRDPITIDFTRPKATIQGIVGGPTGR